MFDKEVAKFQKILHHFRPPDFLITLASIASMAFVPSPKRYPCADCKVKFTAMKLFPSTWEDLAYESPETIEEALHQKDCTGTKYKKVCPPCELRRRQQWESAHGLIHEDATKAKGTTEVGVTQGSGSAEVGVTQGRGSAGSGIDDPPSESPHPWASMATIRHEMTVHKRRNSTNLMGKYIQEAKAKMQETEKETGERFDRKARRKGILELAKSMAISMIARLSEGKCLMRLIRLEHII